MSIHKNDIERLLEDYTSAHQRGAHHTTGTLLPSIVRALVAYVEEVTGTEIAASVDSTKSTIAAGATELLTITADKVSIKGDVAVESGYNPLAIMEDFFTAKSAEEDTIRAGAAEIVAKETADAEAEPTEETTEEPQAEEPATDDAPADETAPKAPKRGARKA